MLLLYDLNFSLVYNPRAVVAISYSPMGHFACPLHDIRCALQTTSLDGFGPCIACDLPY